VSEDKTVILKSVIEHKHSPRKNLTKVTISNNTLAATWPPATQVISERGGP
jgi:hypothetical protein